MHLCGFQSINTEQRNANFKVWCLVEDQRTWHRRVKRCNQIVMSSLSCKTHRWFILCFVFLYIPQVCMLCFLSLPSAQLLVMVCSGFLTASNLIKQGGVCWNGRCQLFIQATYTWCPCVWNRSGNNREKKHSQPKSLCSDRYKISAKLLLVSSIKIKIFASVIHKIVVCFVWEKKVFTGLRRALSAVLLRMVCTLFAVWVHFAQGQDKISLWGHHNKHCYLLINKTATDLQT